MDLTDEHAIRVMLDTYRSVEAYACQPGSKSFRKGAPTVSPYSRGNRAAKNGTGNLVVVDIDPRNGGAIARLFELFPGVKATRTAKTATASRGGVHLVYRLPDGFPVRTGIDLSPGIEIPRFYMLPMSQVNGHRYMLNEFPVAYCPTDLLAFIANDVSERAVPPVVRATGSHEGVQELLATYEQAPPGQRNKLFLETALPVLRALGPEKGALALEQYNPGIPDDEFKHKVNSALRKLESGDSYLPSREVSKYRDDALVDLLQAARAGRWEGRTGAVDRAVFLVLAWRAVVRNDFQVDFPPETIATETGFQPKTVRNALERLQNQGRTIRVFDGEARWHLVCSEFTRYLSKERETYLGEVFGDDSRGWLLPVWDEVWDCDGLTGRHCQIFDLVSLGAGSVTALSEQSGAGKSTVSEAVSALVESGLLVRDGRALRVVDDAVEVAEVLKRDRGGLEHRLRLSEAITRDHERLEKALDPEKNERRLLEEAAMLSE
ncbi:bifunctional DNA primase/polymerase [Corynebacterium flavescens]|uniref:bifunctional DNA primase/polymerase n=1 Tax=Corynebacterium flavescens TaxID=28028 RepID=UPI003FD3A406